MVLSASGAPFVTALPHERQEAFFEGHAKSFEFFGGVPQTITYDNLKTAVSKVLAGHNRIEQSNFTAFKSHYLFDSIFCNPARGNEKGKVEGFVGYARGNFFVPLPEFKSYEELNIYLAKKYQDYIAKAKRIGKLVSDVFEQEKSKLLDFPHNPFPCCLYIDTQVNSYSQVQFESNRYSVPTKHAYQKVQLQAYVNTIKIYKDGNLIAKHERSYDKGNEYSQLDHYLDVLATKPRAVENAKPLKAANLPASYHELKEKINQKHKVGNHEFIKILKLHRSYPSSLVTQAIELALEYQVYHFEGVRNLLLQLLTPETKHKPLNLYNQPQLSNVVVLKPSSYSIDRQSYQLKEKWQI